MKTKEIRDDELESMFNIDIDKKAVSNGWSEERKKGYAAGYNTAKKRMESIIKQIIKEKDEEHIELCRMFPYNLISDILEGEGNDDHGEEDISTFSPYLIRKTMNETLTEREFRILELRYSDGMTLQKAADEFELSRDRIRQIEIKAIRKLSHPARISRMKAVAYTDYIRLLKENEDLKKELKKLKNMPIRTEDSEETEQKLKMTILDLSLSVRSYNSLKRAGVNTVGDIVELFKSGEILKCRNLGIKSIQEVRDVLHNDLDIEVTMPKGIVL